MTYSLTAQQRDIVQTVAHGSGHVAVVARAGTGKSSTIEHIIAAYHKRHPRHDILVCAFNKPIVNEMQGRLKDYDWRTVQVQTAHSMGFSLVKFMFKCAVDADKVSDIVRGQTDHVYRKYKSQIEQLVRLAKDAAFGHFCDVNDVDAWLALADHHDVDGIDSRSDMLDVVEAAQAVYGISLSITNTVDFSDMILFPLVMNMKVKFQKDLIIVDEAQDLSPARQALILKFLKPGGKMVVVGDDRQAIYGFAGADAEALPNLIKKLDAAVLPLTITWRCPKNVVALANGIVPDLQHAPNAADGHVLYRGEALEAFAKLTVTDAILCRKMAPLVANAYALLRAGIPAKVEGRDIGKNLRTLISRWKITTIDALLQRIEAYRIRETQKALAKHKESKVSEINDRVQTIRELAHEALRKGRRDVDAVYEQIDALFGDDVKNAVTLCTFHRSKGREWDHVFILPSKPWRAAQPWQRLQERNLEYVAYTRAKHTLAILPEPEKATALAEED